MSLAQAPPLRDAVAPHRTKLLVRLRRFQPVSLLWFAAVIALAFLVVAPVGRLLVSSFQSTDTGAFTLANYAIAWGRPRELIALGNSLRYAVETTLLSAVFAVPIAWSVSRTDVPGKGLIRALILGAFITPPYLGAIGWILLAGPNAGWLNRVWMAATGSASGFVSIYSFGGLVWVTALYAFPYIFVFTSAALDLVSSEMEEAANILGAGGLRTIFRITLPLVLPAILGGGIIVFLDTVALFGTPAIIALPARIPTMTLVLWQFFEFPVRAEAAAAYAIPLIADHAGAVRDATAVAGPQRLRRADRQGRRTAVGAAWPVSLAGARLCAVRGGDGSAPALCGAGAGGVRQGMGPGLRLGQPDARQFPRRAVRGRTRARRSSIPSPTRRRPLASRSRWRWSSPISSAAA